MTAITGKAGATYMKRAFRNIVVAAGMAALSIAPVGAAEAGSSAAGQTTSDDSSGKHSWTMEQIVTSSVREAWALGGKTDEGFFEIVQALAQLSAQKRGVTPPDTEAAGAKAGNWIRTQARKDPDQLLYCIVDHAVQYSAAHSSK
jgi:hypothetical protein